MHKRTLVVSLVILFVLASCAERPEAAEEQAAAEARDALPGLDEARAAARPEATDLRELRAELDAVELVLLSWTWRDAHGLAIAEGEVRNVSDRPVDDAEAVISFRSDAGAVVTSISAMVERNPIPPGQTSPFRIDAVWDPSRSTAGIDFRASPDGTIGWMTIDEYTRAEQQLTAGASADATLRSSGPAS